MFVELRYNEVEVIPHEGQWIGTLEFSNDKTMVALVKDNETISVLYLTSLVELFQYSANHISCSTFTAGESFVLYKKLETAVSIVEKQSISFFHGSQEMFESCA